MVFFNQSCNLVNPPEPTPTYIHVDSFNFIPTPNTGTSSHKITSVWAYFEGRTLGAFPIPCNIPIITSKPGQLILRPGITYDGIQDIQTIYFQYRYDTMTIQSNPGKITTVIPKTMYYSDTVLNILNNDFESGNSFIKVDGDTGLNVTSNPEYVFEGVYGGLIVLDSQANATVMMQQNFSKGGSPFVEINYKSTLPFQIGLRTVDNTGQSVVLYLAGFVPKSNWNKVYVGLQDFFNQFPNGSYNLVIRVLSSEPTKGYVALDNVKVVTEK
jgi:hypothetical protein